MKTEDKVQAQNVLLNDILDCTTDVIFSKARDGRYQSINAAGANYFGMPAENIIGKTDAELFPPEVAQRIMEVDRHILVSGEDVLFEETTERDDRNTVWSSSKSARRDGQGSIIGLVGVVRDITEHKRAEEELIKAKQKAEENEEKFRNIFEKSSDAILIIDNGIFTDCNMATVEMLEYKTKVDFLNVHPSVLSPEKQPDGRSSDDKAEEMMDLALLNGTHRFEWMHSRSSGEVFPVEVLLTAISSETGNKVIHCVWRDLTERKEAEEREKELRGKLSRAERIESLGVLAGGVAHDLNNVLGPMVLLPDIISEDLASSGKESSDDVAESLNVIKTSAKRAASIVRDLVALGRRGNYNLVPMNINRRHCIAADCADIVHIKRANPGVSFVHTPAKGPLIISADDAHFSRAICNLLRNAAESIETTGRVATRTFAKRIDKPLNGYETIPKGDYAVVEISDTGTGIGEELLARMFEPFVTRKKNTDGSGSGLGLSVVHGIIKDHSGFIDVASDIGKGSVFTLYMPLIDRVKADEKESQSESVTGGTERILIVDDEPGQRFIVRMSLKRLGYEVL